MNQTERSVKILAFLEETPKLNENKLMNYFVASKDTARRDINKLLDKESLSVTLLEFPASLKGHPENIFQLLN